MIRINIIGLELNVRSLIKDEECMCMCMFVYMCMSCFGCWLLLLVEGPKAVKHVKQCIRYLM